METRGGGREKRKGRGKEKERRRRRLEGEEGRRKGGKEP